MIRDQVLPAVSTDHGHYIAGERPSSPRRLQVVDPTTTEAIATIANGDERDVDTAVTAASQAFAGEWSATPPSQKARLLQAVADEIEAKREDLAAVETIDCGKLYRESLTQVAAMAKWFRYFAGLADKIEGKTIPSDKPSLLNLTLKQPLGVVGCITPWNSPLVLASWKLAPALAAGNTVVVKPSEHASLSTLALADCFEAAGVPAGVFNVVTGDGATAGKALVHHPEVAKISFTGSEIGGRAVSAAAAGRLAAVSTELGGKSANILFPDCEIPSAVEGIISGVFAAAGQTCMAGSRALIHESIYDEVVARLQSRLGQITVGDPFADATDIGPIANEPQFERVLTHIATARDQGAGVLAGGTQIGDRGYFVAPTILDRVKSDMNIWQEEVFGPVLVAHRFSSDNEALQLANSTCYGLAGGVWTADLSRAIRFAKAVVAGTVWINTYRAVAPNMPFGGFKNSGSGRESGSEAIAAFVATKSVWIETDPQPVNPFTIKA